MKRILENKTKQKQTPTNKVVMAKKFTITRERFDRNGNLISSEVKK